MQYEKKKSTWQLHNGPCHALQPPRYSEPVFSQQVGFRPETWMEKTIRKVNRPVLVNESSNVGNDFVFPCN
ncbi:MAG: hypothetical protein ACKPKO_18705, partial [Candidatus Fonsibacter sp.]